MAPHRRVHGVLLLDKPAGITSNAALRAVQRRYGAERAGHTGTLDPLATGLLPLCFGDAARFAHLLLDADKSYRARVRLGSTTSTGDLEGEVTSRLPVTATRADVEAVLPQFTGEIAQIPPMYSALKKDGRPLYELARAGLEVARAPRQVWIAELVLTDMAGDEFELIVTCGKGTYVRTLAEDIGRALGCGACLAALRRTRVGGFTLDQNAHQLQDLESMSEAERNSALLPPDALAAGLPRFELDALQASRIAHGQAIDLARAAERGIARIYGPDLRFLGLGEVTAPGRIEPRRLVSGLLAR